MKRIVDNHSPYWLAALLLAEGGTRWRGPGGQSVYESTRGWIVVYHSYDADDHGMPTLRIRDLYWDGDGWPTTDVPTPTRDR